MKELWDGFIFGFCKVEFLCYAGEPNWLGIGVLGAGYLFLLWVLVNWFDERSRTKRDEEKWKRQEASERYRQEVEEEAERKAERDKQPVGKDSLWPAMVFFFFLLLVIIYGIVHSWA